MSNLRILLAVAACGPFFGSSVGVSAAVFKQGEITQIFREVKTLEASGAHDARLNEMISGDQSIKTGPQSRAELRFADQSLTRLGADTIFSFQQGTRELELKQGTILFSDSKGCGRGEDSDGGDYGGDHGNDGLLRILAEGWEERDD